MTREDGQATVELVALLPLVLLVALAAAGFVAAQSAAEQAGQAAQAGAMALLQGRDPRSAARAALPRHAHAMITVHGPRVTVRVRPHFPIPAFGGPLTATATADAGAVARPAHAAPRPVSPRRPPVALGPVPVALGPVPVALGPVPVAPQRTLGVVASREAAS